MSLVEELKNENNEIKELRTLLTDLVSNQSLRNNSVFCELIQRFQNKLDDHLKHEARAIYPELLNHENKSIKKVANDFLSNTHELDRIKSKYVKRWCHNPNTNNQDDFEKETNEIFKLVDERIKMEESCLFSVL